MPCLYPSLLSLPGSCFVAPVIALSLCWPSPAAPHRVPRPCSAGTGYVWGCGMVPLAQCPGQPVVPCPPHGPPARQPLPAPSPCLAQDVPHKRLRRQSCSGVWDRREAGRPGRSPVQALIQQEDGGGCTDKTNPLTLAFSSARHFLAQPCFSIALHHDFSPAQQPSVG